MIDLRIEVVVAGSMLIVMMVIEVIDWSEKEWGT
jgi:hypothetical protein